ncbi:hypothetical protein F4779DRAFT_564904 [Xylariaceae sp. FL0662B]|nr:hypothetical protein F4779DRAFT_564904 [Xylariaceae sp. FL0662B]
MRVRHFQAHGHGHHHFHSRASHIDIGEAGQLDAGGSAGSGPLEGDGAPARLVARVNDMDEKPVGSTMTVPIVLGVCIPLGIALCVLVYLHRRTTARQRREDEADKYKSMDFGLDNKMVGNGKRRSAFFAKEKDPSHRTQLSMDMNLSSPYLLPPHMHNSRESLNSLAKSLHQNEDPYRPVTTYTGSDVGSLRSYQRGADRDSSAYNAKTRSSGDRDSSRMRPIATDPPPRQRSLPPSPIQPPTPTAQPLSFRESVEDAPAPPAKNEFRFVDDGPILPQVPEIQEPPPTASHARKDATESSRPFSKESVYEDQSYAVGVVGDRDSMALPLSDIQQRQQGFDTIDTRSSKDSSGTPPAVTNPAAANRPPRQDSMPIDSSIVQDYQDYAEHFQVDSYGSDEIHSQQRAQEHEYPQSAGLGVPDQDNRRLSVGFRPLPPEDFLESEDPEFRANRIRSFYKEYFEDATVKTNSGKPPPLPPQPTPYEDYDTNYMGDAAFFDPDTNAFVMPYAQPVTRRAMTPPPNSRRPMPGPRQRGPHGPHGSFGGANMPYGPPGRPRAGSSMSANRWAAPSPRPGSSASNFRPAGPPKKPVPPPIALSTLPTPSKLRDDSFAIMGAIDFAPPPTFKDQAAGRSQSPVGERRPYAVNTPAFSPLVSAFDETAALPSPHLLRKSGTFTGLDFAPPRRFKDPDTMSDSGSVHSFNSGISSANLSALRAGAGRVSRLPGDTVFTQASSNHTLKPTWNMRD